MSKGKMYTRIWIYVPTKVREDSAFPFKIGDPCEIEIDSKKRALVIRTIPQDKAIKEGWSKRDRTSN